ncbi:malate dehydrogenase [Thiohalorhabdus denitrificans]|uniref:Malate dehydrogenase n=1 Tax=Thiohalorhabdus denitrificans TaxID=381306 RepID=A0A0P9EKU2_9GAMM|nr:malate dehydrogenase [Thiohalorhabdus denitrificans]KPV39176.1 malate dehydrogenase [Thiohalorhabdus denitrificans]SCX75763.1 malate dehydrogenase (NAD) [Thiohalorhabdus denitrificans]
MHLPKIAMIGAGQVGSTAAHLIAKKELGNLVLLDIDAGMAQGKALDIAEAGPVDGFDVAVTGTDDYAEIAGSEVVVITAGLARKPGMDRAELLRNNVEIVAGIAREVARHAPEAYVIVVTNPLDAMVCTVKEVTGFPAHRVMGMAGVLDSARMRRFIAEELGVSGKDVTAMVLGGHGDRMVPVRGSSTVGGIPITELLPADRLDAIVERTRHGGGEVVELLKTGSAYYAPGASITEMVESIVRDQGRIRPVAAHLQGEYGVSDLYIGVPAIIGAGGVERVVEIRLTQAEREQFDASVEAVRNLIAEARAARQS